MCASRMFGRACQQILTRMKEVASFYPGRATAQVVLSVIKDNDGMGCGSSSFTRSSGVGPPSTLGKFEPPRYKAEQTEARKQHGIGLWFRDGTEEKLSMVIDPDWSV